MRKSGGSPRLTVVESGATALDPPRPLGPEGRGLWDRVQREYDVSDPAGIEFLTLAAEALDRSQSLSEAIARDGEIIRTPAGIRTHPAVREELANRAFVTRTLQRLGLNFEPLRSGPGRPPGSRA
jgi:hypothetical protein